MRNVLIALTTVLLISTAVLATILLTPSVARAQIIPGQNQVIPGPYPGGFLVSTSSSATHKLGATTTPYFANFFAGTGTIQNLVIAALNGALYAVNGSVKAVSTSTPSVSAPITYSGTLGQFLGGISGAFGCTNASSGVTGCLTGTDWDTFNGKQPAGNYITALTGDVTASGPGSVAATLASVNGDVGSFTNANITVNAKGLITAAASGSGGANAYEIATTSTIAVPELAYFTQASGRTTLGGAATTTFTPSAEFTVGGTIGGLVGGSNSTLTIATAGVALTKLATQAANTVLVNQTSSAASPTALATSTFANTLYSATAAGQALYRTTAGTWVGGATTTAGTGLTYSMLSNLTTNGLVTTSGGTGALSVTANGTNGQVLAMSGGVPTWIASTTYANGTGISTSFATGQLTITNTSPLSGLSTSFPLSFSNPTLSWVGLATSTALANTQIVYGTAAGTIGSEAAFTYDSSTNTFSTDNGIVSTSLRIPNGTGPTTDAAGEIAFDTNAWGASRGAVQVFDGTANTYLVGTLVSDTPANGEVPTWNTGGTITWEPGGGSPAGSDAWATSSPYGTKIIQYPVDTSADLLFGSNSTSTADFWFDVVNSIEYIGQFGASDSFLSFSPVGNATSSIGLDYSTDNFSISMSSTLGTREELVISTATLKVGVGTSTPWGASSIATSTNTSPATSCTGPKT